MMRGNLYKVAPSALLVTLGIVFGDIGTSPLYVFKAITKGTNFGAALILGSLYCVFWTLMPIATIKYVLVAWNADNQGKGGAFLLYARLKKDHKVKVDQLSHPYRVCQLDRFVKSIGLSAIEDLGLDSTNTIEEEIPINVAPREKLRVLRMEN